MERRSSVWLLAALLTACAPETDRAHYETGDVGRVTLRNETQLTVYLGGCGHFDQEQLVGEEWVSRGGDQVCVWEGFADPVLPGEVVNEPFQAREPGTWRLRYPVGVGCSASAPLGDPDCTWLGEVTSNEFEVRASGCLVSGCSGQVCADQRWETTCEWLPHYACYQAANCGAFGADGSCGWEPTPELEACLAELDGAPASRSRAPRR
jgi:hypothetical protein